MKLALKIFGGVVLVLVLMAGGAVALFFHDAAKPENPVGFEQVTVRDPQGKPLDVGIWYPTSSKSGRTLLGLSVQMVAENGAVVGRNLPLVVISHGNGGAFSSHSDTALALASAGFVVAAVTHTGDNYQDQSYIGTQRWFIDRARHIHLVLDYMLDEWPEHQQLDSTRIGMFGFSAGGTTTLISIGGVPDLVKIPLHCTKHPEFACTLWKQTPARAESVSTSAWVHDPRIKAAVVIAPGYGFAFEPDGLSQIKASVQLWNGVEDKSVPYETNEAVVRRLLPNPPEYHSIPGAAHFTFLAPCPSILFPLLCKDANGFDRVNFHRALNRAVVNFFETRLTAQ